MKIEPAQAVAEVEPLPEDYYTRPVNLTEGNILCPSVLLCSPAACVGTPCMPRNLGILIVK